jgi:hypothetical protein
VIAKTTAAAVAAKWLSVMRWAIQKIKTQERPAATRLMKVPTEDVYPIIFERREMR